MKWFQNLCPPVYLPAIFPSAITAQKGAPMDCKGETSPEADSVQSHVVEALSFSPTSLDLLYSGVIKCVRVQIHYNIY